MFSLRPLEFDRIVDAVAALALTPFGAQQLRALAPASDPATVTAALNRTSEMAAFLERHDLFPLRASDGVEGALAALGIDGRPLEPLELRALADLVDSLDRTRAAILAAGPRYPFLHGLASHLPSFASEAAAVACAIDASGEVLDDASSALRRIRDALRATRQRLRQVLEQFVRARETAKYLQDDVITERSGRFVLVVRAEHRAHVPGIVHGASATGASLYIEPAATVELGNDLVELQERERAEVWRVLLQLTDGFRVRAADLAAAVGAAAALDELQAKARYGARLGAVAPTIAADSRLEIRGARHPLLAEPVPVDVLVLPPVQALLITGPNTGGKTVALKTAGLLALMAQSGLHVPAASASLPVFRTIAADIGDEQSIADSLSTFSAHIATIVAVDRDLELPALVLLDEVGTGTDPNEGGALATAIVNHFRQRGALVIATTHYDALKTWGTTTPGVTTAAFAFDPQTFAPTYALVYGAPGRSLALEIAQRHGLPLPVVAAARGFLGDDRKRLAAHLERLDAQARALEADRARVARDRRALEEQARALAAREQAVAEREARLARRINERLDERLRQARREIDEVVAAMRARADALVSEAGRAGLSTGDAGALRAEALTALTGAVERAREVDVASAPAAPREPVGPLAVGARVVVSALGLEGTVVALHGGQAEVEVRGKRLKARADALQVVARPGTAPAARVRVNVSLQPREGPLTELNVVGCTVDDARDRVARFLDDTLVTGVREVRIVHGYGTGQLRKGLHRYLREHPLVARFATAPDDQGGGGATIVELKS